MVLSLWWNLEWSYSSCRVDPFVQLFEGASGLAERTCHWASAARDAGESTSAKDIQDILSFRLAVFIAKDFSKWEANCMIWLGQGRPNEGEWHCPIPTWPHNKNQNTVCFNFRKGCLVDIQMLNFLCILVVLLLPNSWRLFFGKFGEAVGSRNWAKESHNPIRPCQSSQPGWSKTSGETKEGLDVFGSSHNHWLITSFFLSVQVGYFGWLGKGLSQQDFLRTVVTPKVRGGESCTKKSGTFQGLLQFFFQNSHRNGQMTLESVVPKFVFWTTFRCPGEACQLWPSYKNGIVVVPSFVVGCRYLERS